MAHALSYPADTLSSVAADPQPHQEIVMDQPALVIDTPQPDAVDRTGFELGWDHARHGLVPGAGLLLDGTPVSQGWRAARAVFGARTAAPSRAARQWLELRTTAWRHGVAFETTQLTPHLLAQLEVSHCPVLRVRLGGARGDASAPSFARLNADAGYAAGNVAQVCADADRAWQGVGVAEAVQRARRAEADGAPVAGLDAGAWWRAAVLRSFATPMPFAEAARLPLAVLPPNRVRVLNAVQGLQALLTLHFTAPGWAERLRSMAAWLPDAALRQDFNLFVGAMLPRVLDAARLRRDPRRALEDAWLCPRVQRRWQQFALSLGETACEALLERVATVPVPGRRTLAHEPDAAVDGWAIETGGRVGMAGAAVTGPAAPPAARRRTARPRLVPALRATALRRPAAT